MIGGSAPALCGARRPSLGRAAPVPGSLRGPGAGAGPEAGPEPKHERKPKPEPEPEPKPRDRGSVTAELAICLPAVVLVLTLVLALGAVSVTQLRYTDAARAGARAAALGYSETQIRSIVAERAGPGAQVRVSTDVEGARVWVGRSFATGSWGSWQIEAEFVAVPEPTGHGP